MVAIARRRQVEQRLQQPMDRGRGEKVAPAHDVGDALQRVVDRHREMIARREIAPAEDDVAPTRRLRGLLDGRHSLAEFGPDEADRRASLARRMSSRNAALLAPRLAARDGRSRKAPGRRPNRAAPRPDRAD